MRTHKAVTRTEARGLGSCAGLDISFCQCRAFKAPGMARWVEPVTLPETGEHTLAQAAAYLANQHQHIAPAG